MPSIARQPASVRKPARRLAKSGAISAALAACIAGLVTGCQRHSQATEATAAVDKNPVGVEEGRLVLPAVAGHPASAYFKITNLTKDVINVDGLSITGTREAEMHATVYASMDPLPRLELDPMQMVPFSPGGNHVMAFGVDPGLKPGSRVRMTLRLDRGRTVSAWLKVEPASAVLDDGMSGMDMHR